MTPKLQTQVFKAGSTTYFHSSLFFPPAMRNEVFILYGFVRVADNLVDAIPQDAVGFARFVARYRAALVGTPAEEPIIVDEGGMLAAFSMAGGILPESTPLWTYTFVVGSTTVATKIVANGDTMDAPEVPAAPPVAAQEDKATPMDARLRGHDESKDIAATPPAKKKLSYKDQRELDQLPARIEQLEADVAERTAAMQDAAFYKQEAAAQQRANAELATAQAELDAAYARWEVLDG